MDDKSLIQELVARNNALQAQVVSLESKVGLLLEELSKQKLLKDSSNSHNPPSQDKYKTKQLCTEST